MHPLHRALGSVKGLALTALIVLPVTAATAVATAQAHDPQRESVTASLARPLAVPAALTDQQRLCHGPGALVLTKHGHLRQVSVMRGLRAYEHKAPGTFVALCTTHRGDSAGS